MARGFAVGQAAFCTLGCVAAGGNYPDRVDDARLLLDRDLEPVPPQLEQFVAGHLDSDEAVPVGIGRSVLLAVDLERTIRPDRRLEDLPGCGASGYAQAHAER